MKRLYYFQPVTTMTTTSASFHEEISHSVFDTPRKLHDAISCVSFPESQHSIPVWDMHDENNFIVS